MKWHALYLLLATSFVIFYQTHTVLPGGCIIQIQCKPDNFFEKEADVNQNLYRISATELQELLGTDYDPIPTISADDLHDLLYGIAHNPELIVINVLPKKLYDDCRISGSHSIPLKDLVCTVKEWPRDQKIVVYCALDICDAGQKAFILLSCMGFTDVIDYEGGIKEWYQLGYPIEGPAQSSYLHARNAKLPDELLKDLEECCGVEVPRDHK